MSEIQNNLLKNSAGLDNSPAKINKTTVETNKQQEIPAVFPKNDENAVTVKESKNPKTTNISFIDEQTTEINASVDVKGVKLGLSLTLNVGIDDTKALLSSGKEMIRKGQVEFKGGMLRVKDNPVASILFSFAMAAAQQQMEAENKAVVKENLKPRLQTFEKMVDKNTKASDFSAEEKAFLWKNAGIEVSENNGTVEYLYYETPGSPPRKLTDEEVQQVYLHILNIMNNDDLFSDMLDTGNEMNQLFEAGRPESREDEKSAKNDEEEKNYHKKFKIESNQPFLNKLQTISTDNEKDSTYTSENTYLSKSAERRQEETNYHYKKLKDLDQARLVAMAQENRDRAAEAIKNQKKQEEILNKDH